MEKFQTGCSRGLNSFAGGELFKKLERYTDMDSGYLGKLGGGILSDRIINYNSPSFADISIYLCNY